MSRLLHVVTHPEVQVEPGVPVPEWALSNDGLRRAQGLLALSWVRRVAHVFSSAERKAMQTAELLAAACGGPRSVVDEALGENDRSATGFLPPAEFEAVADLFFREPTESVRGWESALTAQQRVVMAVDRCLARATTHDLAVVTHGAVGTLLWCHLAGEPIDRKHDQPGQGSWYSVDLATMRPLSAWTRLQSSR
jgi:broad specificity phosphatase PhoE